MKKRLLDLTLVALSAPIWVPVLLLTTAAIALVDGRPVFYRSKRRVQRRLTMPIVKFRVMVRNAEALFNREVVPVVTQRFLNTPINSPLYTRLGRLVERCQITELPQIFHVIAGKMTVVGNRPLPENVIAALVEAHPMAEDRFATACGLTGVAQLVGREQLTDGERLALESHYCAAVASHYSVRLDLLVLTLTILLVCHLHQPLSVAEVHALIDKYSQHRQADLAHPAAR